MGASLIMWLLKPNAARMARKGDVEGLLRASGSTELDIQMAGLHHAGLLLGRWFVLRGNMNYEVAQQFHWHSADVCQSLAAATQSREPTVRSIAATALSQLFGTYDQSALGSIVALLDDPSPEVRRSAVASLVFWSFGTADLKAEWSSRTALSAALTGGNILRRLEDADDWTREQVADVLAHIEEQKLVLEALKKHRAGQGPRGLEVVSRMEAVSTERASILGALKKTFKDGGISHERGQEEMSRRYLPVIWMSDKARALADSGRLAANEVQFYLSVAVFTRAWIEGRV